MQSIFYNALVLDARSEWNEKHVNIHIQEGKIAHISPARPVEGEAQIIDCSAFCVSVGWIDMRVLLPEPGLEYKETLEQGAKSAQKGGFTDIVLLPNTLPVRQTKHDVAFVKQHPAQSIVKLHPLACITLEAKGHDLTDMIDLHHAGAVGFTDGILPTAHTGILLKTLQYLQPFDGLLIQRPDDKLLTQYGVMHEGVQSTMLGLNGMPPLAETLLVQRDLQLLEYAGGRLHFSLVSCKESVQMIREAKRKGLQVTCDVAVHQLFFDDSALQGFDSFYKVNPPFRTQDHIDALWEGLADGTIDAIVSDHNPQDEESKNLELDMAEFGIIGLETFFSVLHTANSRRANPLSLPALLATFTTKPREILRLPLPALSVGEEASLTFFDLDSEVLPTAKSTLATSKNSPFFDVPLRGKAVGVFRAGKFSVL